MVLVCNSKLKLIVLSLFCVFLLNAQNKAFAASFNTGLPTDTIKKTNPRFIIPQMGLTPYSETNESPLYLSNPANFGTDITYDPVKREYIFRNTMGGRTVGVPYSMSPEEYKEYQFSKSINQYWKAKFLSENKSKSSQSTASFFNPKINIDVEGFDRIFGTNTIDIKPQGAAELIFGVSINNVDNPALPSNVQRQVLFDFDEKIQMGVNGKIGDKLNLGINYDTEATFQFQNKTKLGYKGKEDEIIQNIEAGNVSLPLTGTLITGSHNLFGLKTELKFGHLTITSVFSQQKGESKVINVEGGAQTNTFKIDADQYEANRHFFLSHFFRNTYDQSLSSLPVIKTGITITKVEVWITNRSGNFGDARNIVGFMDLGEGYDSDGNPNFAGEAALIEPTSTLIPTNETNKLYTKITDLSDGIRNFYQINQSLEAFAFYNFIGGNDFEKIENAKKLSSSDFSFNSRLGYISLNRSLNADEVLAVAYEYTYNGATYRVGEFSDGEIKAPKTLIVKLLKGTNLTPKLKTWDLMMKNIYSMGAWQVEANEFIADIKYRNDRTGTAVNYISEGDIKNQVLLQVLNLDELNSAGDPSPDGRFDFVNGITIDAAKGRIIFPVLEPFGSYLRKKINNPAIADRYTFEALYDSTQSKAGQNTEKNKFFIEGKYRSSQGADILLGAANVEPGSVVVTAGGAKLAEGEDYIVDYTMGRVTIINSGLLESGKPISVALEDNAQFSFGTQKTMMGAHLNYKFSDKFNLGGTLINLTEKPITPKVNFGEEPISNTIWGFNGTYSNNLPSLTKWIDKLPFLETKTMSSITVEGEFAHLIPGHPSYLSKQGISYIDDFEGSRTSIDMKNWGAWILASTPQGQNQFKEGNLNNNLAYGYNRAKLAWYNINTDLNEPNYAPDPLKKDLDQLSNHFVRRVFEKEIFPNKESQNNIQINLPIFNLAYYPAERGPYNYDLAGEPNISAGINPNGTLKNPETRWGGIMRKVHVNDFEAANIEFIDFWLMDPFVYDTEHTGGELIFQLGNISEDVLRDGRKFFENGLPVNDNIQLVDTTAWGRVPVSQNLVNAFDSNSETRKYQDVGFDGLGNWDEKLFFRNFVTLIGQQFGTASEAYLSAANDPSSDDYHYFKGSDFDTNNTPILERFKRFNNTDGNSPTREMTSEEYNTLAYLTPDIEDINADNTLSENESYFQYKVTLRPEDMQVGSNYITDIITDSGKRENGKVSEVKWYHFKVPIYEPQRIVGQIQDFKSIRFMRMLLTDFEEPVILRFARLDLVRSDWRKYIGDLTQAGEVVSSPESGKSTFDVSVINIEENGKKEPVNYVLPPGINREEDISNPYFNKLNEQSLMLKVIGMEDGDSKAVYKNINLDVRKYKRVEMHVHMEEINNYLLKNNDLSLFVRIGTDYKENYYEYEIPLEITPPGIYADNDANRLLVWPANNSLNLDFEVLQNAKQQRNNAMRVPGSTVSLTRAYTVTHGDKNTIKIMGNPNLANVRTIMIGVRNPNMHRNRVTDDGFDKSAEIWVNELRLTNFNEEGGWAANARINAKLADFGSVTIVGSTMKPGFGSIEKKINERSQEDLMQYDVSGNFEIGKFFPKETNVKIPVYVGYSERMSNPEYNPLDPDILMSSTLSNPELSSDEKEKIKSLVQDYTVRKSLNLTNVKIAGSKSESLNPLYIGNFTAGVGYNEIYSHNISTDFDLKKVYTGSFAYNYNARPKPVEPFKNSKSKLMRNKNLRIIRDFNFYYLPKMLAFRNDVNKQFQATKYRNIDLLNAIIPTNFKKDFIWNRTYDVKYDLTRDLKFDFSANNAARVDEPDGWIRREYDDFYLKRDSVWANVMNGGRTTAYNQQFGASWTVPINKLPLLDWTTLTARYNSTYEWQAARILADKTLNLGNKIKNTNQIQLNGQLNFRNLYSKVGYFKRLDQKMKQRSSGKQSEKKFKEVIYEQEKIELKADRFKTIGHGLKTTNVTALLIDSKGRTVKAEVEVVDENAIKIKTPAEYTDLKLKVTGKREERESIALIIAETTINSMLGFKSLSINYTQSGGTMLPGYLPQSKLFGSNTVNNMSAPGALFILGYQDKNFARYAADNGWLTSDSLQNEPFSMMDKQSLNLRGSFEPFNGMRIDLSAQRSFALNRTEQWLTNDAGSFYAANSKLNGNFSISFNGIKTMFKPRGDKQSQYNSEPYNNFVNSRLQIAEALASRRQAADPNYNPNALGENDTEGFPAKYGPLQQDVLLFAFLSAYSGNEMNVQTASPFRFLPDINWQVTYDGFSNIPLVKKVFKKINISHGYRSNYSIGSFEAFNHEGDGFNFVRNASEQNFTYNLASVIIDEQFNPMFNIDLTWNNNISTKFEIKKTRNLSLGFTNNQLIEVNSQEYLLGTGFRISKVPIGIKVGGKQRKFESDLNMRFDFSIRDAITITRRIGENQHDATAGQTNITIKTTADYVLNERLNIRFFADFVSVDPAVDSSFNTSNTKFGISVRFTLIP